jgi:hypothetical protein
MRAPSVSFRQALARSCQRKTITLASSFNSWSASKLSNAPTDGFTFVTTCEANHNFQSAVPSVSSALVPTYDNSATAFRANRSLRHVLLGIPVAPSPKRQVWRRRSLRGHRPIPITIDMAVNHDVLKVIPHVIRYGSPVEAIPLDRRFAKFNSQVPIHRSAPLQHGTELRPSRGITKLYDGLLERTEKPENPALFLIRHHGAG